LIVIAVRHSDEPSFFVSISLLGLGFYGNRIQASAPATNGQRTLLNYQQVGDTKYFNAAGCVDRTVGLSTSLDADSFEEQPSVA
jgi:hypothetical protein